MGTHSCLNVSPCALPYSRGHYFSLRNHTSQPKAPKPPVRSELVLLQRPERVKLENLLRETSLLKDGCVLFFTMPSMLMSVRGKLECWDEGKCRIKCLSSTSAYFMVKLFCISHGNCCCVCSVRMHADCSISKKSGRNDLVACF